MKYNKQILDSELAKIQKINIVDYFANHHCTKKYFKPRPTTAQILNHNKRFKTIFTNGSAKNSNNSNKSDNSANIRLKTKKKLLNHGFSR